MFKKALSVGLVSGAFMFCLMGQKCFGQPWEEGSNNLEKVDLLYEYVTGMRSEDDIWLQMWEAMKNISRGKSGAAQVAVDTLLADFSENQYLPIALHEIAKTYGHFKEYAKGLQYHQYVIEHWATHEYAMWSGRDVARLNIELDNMEGAQTAVDQVLSNFSQQEYIALVVYELAEHYRKFAKYQKAKELYQHILDTWPTNWRVVLAQSGLAKLYINMGDQAAAEAAINKLRTGFLDNGAKARAIYDVAFEYQDAAEHQKANQLCEYVLSNWPADPYAMWCQSRLAVSLISLGELPAAQTAAGRLIADFQVEPRIAEAVYDVAQQYQQLNHHEKAKQLYQYVLDSWPQWKDWAWAKVGLARCYISLGDGATAESIIDSVIAKLDADFPPGTELSSKAVEGYYYAAGCYGQLDLYEKSIQCYQRVVDDCPDYELAWNAQFLVGRNYESLKKSGVLTESQANPKIRAAYERILQAYPDTKAAKYAQKWLSR